MIAETEMVRIRLRGGLDVTDVVTPGVQVITRVEGERWLASRAQPGDWELEAVPVCLCCGSAVATSVAVVEGEPVYRCEKHVGRNPCCIQGCGRTFAHKATDADGRGSEDYSWTLICARHWRMVPQRMRDAVARARKQAKRSGWTMRQHRRHHRLWSRCLRAIRGGERLDPAEINRLFGWSEQE